MTTKSKKRFEIISFLLRAGIGLPFLYAALSSFLTPDAWVGFLPRWVHPFGAERILMVFSVYEIFLALWLFYGKWIFVSAFLSFVTVGGVILQNLGAFDIVFRDVSMLFIALVLVIMHADDNVLLRMFVYLKRRI